MARQLDTTTLDAAARHYAAMFLQPDRKTRIGKRWITGPAYIEQDFHNFTYRDEFEHMIDGVRNELGARPLVAFDEIINGLLKDDPRDDAVFHQLLADTLAITPDGEHIEGKRGTTSLGTRIIGTRAKKVIMTPAVGRALIKMVEAGQPITEDDVRRLMNEKVVYLDKNVKWQIYAGEEEERARIKKGDRLHDDEGVSFIDIFPVTGGANVPNISAEACIGMLNFLETSLDEGAAAAEIRGRTGAQPADPDDTETGTLLFTLPMSGTAFPTAVDDTDGTCSMTANAITDDSSADATDTLTYCRMAATGAGSDDHVDGECGTAGADFNFNTVAIVAGSTVSMTALVFNLSQGSTAT